jgi:hypothetical protein
MQTKSFIIPQGTIKDVNNEDNYIPNEVVYTIIAFKDYINLNDIDTKSFPRFDLNFPNGLPNGIKLIQVEDLIEELDWDNGNFDVTQHFRLSFDPELISESEIQSFVQDELEVLGDSEYSNGASARIIEPFGYIDFYMAIPF